MCSFSNMKTVVVCICLLINVFATAQVSTDSSTFVIIKNKRQYYTDKGTGKPTVVFITGLGVAMDDITDIQNEIAKMYRTFSYDRAGIGKSESLDKERTLQNEATELHEILTAAALNKPFILVGHSRGGLLAQYFTSKYPNMVSGLIILDSPPPDFRWRRRAMRTATEKLTFDSLPKQYYDTANPMQPAIKDELKQARVTDSAAMATIKLPTTIPVTFIASTKLTNEKYSKEDTEIKIELVNGYTKTAPQIRLIFTDKAGHFIYDDEPQLVVKEILLMAAKIKSAGTSKK